MLQLSLAYIVQADREREVAEDLRNRQSLLPRRDARPAATPTVRPAATRPGTARVRSTGA
jgi:hypothetical protein